MCGEVESYHLTFITSTLHGGEWAASRLGLFNPQQVSPASTEQHVKWARHCGRIGQEKIQAQTRVEPR